MHKPLEEGASSDGLLAQPGAASRELDRWSGDRSMADVLEAVRRRGARSRQDIASVTGLSRNVVSHRVAELISAGLLHEGGTGQSTGGRPPRSLSFPPDAGHILVAYLGATSLNVACLDAGTHILARRSEEADVAVGPEATMERILVLFEAVLAEAAVATDLWGIGIALPGPVEFSSGRPVSPPIMPGWNQFPMRSRLSERFGVPVWVDNDVNAMALGEHQHGVSRGHDDVLFVKIGTGIGAGIILEGRLYRGAQGSAGDVGHIQVSDDPSRRCRCGNTGCLEAIVGGAALARDAERLAEAGRSEWLAERLASEGRISVRDLSDGIAHGDPASIELIQKCGHDVGLMLAAAVNLFNPSLVVVGGGVANAGDHLLASMRQVVYGRSLPLATRALDVRRSSLGEDGGVLGLTSMVLDELLAPARLSRWIGRQPSVLVEAEDRDA
jgi:glucokinase-like ROK family protein